MLKSTAALVSLASIIVTTLYSELQPVPKNVSVVLASIPTGAVVKLNGNVIGRTNLIYELTPGSYTFTYSFPGFMDTTATYDISGAVNHRNGGIVELADGLTFTKLKPPFEGNVYLSWVGFTNQLQAPISNSISIYNVETKASGTEAIDPTISQMRQQLHLTDEYTAVSPSGRYFVYSINTVTHSLPEDESLIFHIYDKQTNKILTGTLDSAQVSPTRLKWSHNEEWAVLGGDYGFADYLHIQNDQITIIDGSSCTLDTGEVWYVSVTFSDLPFNGPNSNGKALIRTHGADPNSVTGYTCIVDLNTLKGILISIPDPLGAVFSPDNKIVLLINREGVAQYNLESKQIVWLNKDLTYLSQTDRPNISSSLLTEAIISNTAQYAVIGESVDSKLYEWVYKIPQLQGTIGTSTPGVPNINGSQPTPTGGSAPGGNQVGG